MRGLLEKLMAYLVHLFTASGAVIGLLSLDAVYEHQNIRVFWLMGIAIIIDAVDGTFARWLKVKTILPKIDGMLLDNIIDYLNYVVVPACFLLTTALVPDGWRLVSACLVLLASAYQFCQTDAKTLDHFFKGFPSYWNIVLFYLYFWQTSAAVNLVVILTLILLVFVPIKYVYPSRLEYLSNNRYLRLGMLLTTLIWGATTFGMLWTYPSTDKLLVIISTSYLFVYTIVSIYRTLVTLPNQGNPEKTSVHPINKLSVPLE